MSAENIQYKDHVSPQKSGRFIEILSLFSSWLTSIILL